MSRKKRNSKKRKVKPHSPSPVLSPALSSDISVEDFSPPDENFPPSTSHLHPTMEDITDAEDPIPSTPSFLSRPSSPCNRETDRVNPSPQDSITESNDMFQIPPPLSPHRFISHSTIDANDPPSNPPSHVFDVPYTDPPPPADINDSQPGPFSDFHNKWSATFETSNTWEEFSTNCSQFATDIINSCEDNFHRSKNAAPQRPGRPSARPVSNNRRPLPYNPVEARKIQGLYRLSKKRAARKVLNDSKPSYSGSVDDANSFFTKVVFTKENVPSAPDNNLGVPLTSDEVAKKLRFASNSSPGADKVEYCHLKKIDPKCKILTVMYNRCLEERDVPEMWKTSKTILIHKKGDAKDVSNLNMVQYHDTIQMVNFINPPSTIGIVVDLYQLYSTSLPVVLVVRYGYGL
jgi:hypothetical protein